jgi:hypothetical protein
MKVLDHQLKMLKKLSPIVLQTMGIVDIQHSSLFDKTLKNMQPT